jgi:signal transduction histidine kinase
LKNYPKILLLSLFVLVSCTDKNKKASYAKSTTDSLSLYFGAVDNKNLPKKTRLFSNKKALEVLSIKRNDTSYRNGIYKVAKGFYSLEQDSDLRRTIKILINKSIEKKDSISVAKAYNLLGNQNINLIQNDSAYYYLLKAEKLFRKLNDSINLGQNYIDKAFVQLYEGDYSGCELSCIQALGYYKNFEVRDKQYDAYNLIGICSNELKNFENALIYHGKALKTARDYKLVTKSHLEANSLNNIGVVYQNQNKHQQAIGNFQEALREKDLLKDSPSLYAMIMDNLAYSKLKLNNFSNLPDLFFQSLKIREENDFFSSVIINKIHISEYYATKKDTVNSQRFAAEAFNLAKTTKVSGDLLVSLKQLSIVEHKNASKYSKEYIKISDSIQLEERKAKDRFARIQFETDEIIGEKDKLAEQNRNLVYFFIGTLLIGILLFVIRNQRARNRELLLIQSQQKANEEIYSLMISQQATIEESRVREKKRIAQELHDGVLGRLFGARLNLDSLNKFSDHESINNRFNYLNELKNIEQDIREISHDLNREKYVLINNFIAIVNNLLEEQKSSYVPELRWGIDDKIKWEDVSNTIKINLYRILQESLQNINKYAQASKIYVHIKKIDGKIELNVKDDGLGFDVSGRKKGIGLLNMESRAQECNGNLEIKSKKGKGTMISISVPLNISLI